MKGQQLGFADNEITMRLLALARRDKLIPLSNAIDWEMFRSLLTKATRKERKGPGGRPAIDVLVKFRMLVVQRLYDLSDEELEFQVADRITFRAFVGLTLADDVPDAKTIWEFRETLQKSGTLDDIWDRFMLELDLKGLVANKGRIIDAEIVESERRHLNKDERERHESNKASQKDDLEAQKVQVIEDCHRESQVDLEAEWTQKHGKHYFGYKNTANVDADNKLILDYTVDSANIHDSDMFEDVLDAKRDDGNEIYADKGYAGQKCETAAVEAGGPQKSRIMHKASRNKPLTEDQVADNKQWARTRARVEHVFAWRKYIMGQGKLRTIGKTRAAFTIGMGNLLYNMYRFIFLTRPKPVLSW